MLNYKSLKEHVYEYISNQIRDEALKPGEKINENVICETLKISRTPVREALIQMANDGYIEQIPRRGFVVKSISLERVHNIYEILGALEALAATLSLANWDEDSIDELADMAKQMDELIDKEDYTGYYQAQNEFHLFINKASNNSDLVDMIENLKRSFIRQAYSGNDPDEYKLALKKTNEEHYHIIDLIKAQDSDGLRKYMQEVHWNAKYASMEMLI